MEVAMALALVGALPKEGLEFEGAQGILGSTRTIPRTSPCPLPRQSAGGSNGKFCPDDVMADADTRKNLAKVLRALRHVMKKKAANAHPLFGAGSTAVSMVFTLQKFPCKLKNVRIPLPTPLFENREAHNGKLWSRTLSSQAQGILQGPPSSKKLRLLQKSARGRESLSLKGIHAFQRASKKQWELIRWQGSPRDFVCVRPCFIACLPAC
mmetsp:Transcript_98795/g.318576  ORF Transcript_98795/g.318576 Transcript_98795/m.318576 type:complete len:210 (+) Transcript_98795:155-784(+)